MKILWLNWRDIKNPQAGGAEVMTHETAKRLVKSDNEVTIFTARFPGSKEFEIIDGVKIIRRGNRLTCRIYAYTYYKRHAKGKVDFVIDEVNTIPFFTNFYVIERKIALIHQLAREYWWSEVFFPINLLGYLLEPVYIKLYKNVPTIAASQSTRKDLLKLGFNNVSVFHQGLSVTPQNIIPEKSKDPKILFLGRLTKPKGVLDAILAFEKINQIYPRTRLIIIGKGKNKFTNDLKKLVSKLNLNACVTFAGFASQKDKVELLKEAKIILIPSAREGWNLVPIEANSFGCIPIGYNVPGLRDSIKNEKTGILTKTNNPQNLAAAVISAFNNPKQYQHMQEQGIKWAKNFSWDKTHYSVWKIISEIPYKILWLSWRDIKNPAAGGAERVAIETASRLVKSNNNVTIFTSQFKNAQAKDRIGGIEILRSGNLLTCRLQAFLYYLKNRDFNLIIDEINTIPFFSIFYARQKTVAVVHQLAREYWFTQTVWPISNLGYLLEPFILKLYKNRPAIVVSKSTYSDLEKLGFKNIKIIREGLDFKPAHTFKKQDLILFIGRLTAAKGPQDAITAFKEISQILPTTKLMIIGQGEPKFVAYLKSLVSTLKLNRKITFTGFVTQQQKISFLKKARIVLIPSVREGWNLVATEANATGAIPIAYNVSGLKDSIKDEKTGILVEKNPSALATAAVLLLKRQDRQKILAKNGLNFAQTFSWDNTYLDFKAGLGGKLSEVSRLTPLP